MEQFYAILDRIIVIFSRITWWSYDFSGVFLLVLVCYVAWLIVLVVIHRFLLRRKIKWQKACVREYDNIIYLIAQAEYKIQAPSSSSPLQQLFASKHKNYLANHQVIVDAIRKLEAETKQLIFTPEMEKHILKSRKKLAVSNAFQLFFGGMVSLATAGIYLLFW